MYVIDVTAGELKDFVVQRFQTEFAVCQFNLDLSLCSYVSTHNLPLHQRKLGVLYLMTCTEYLI